MAIQEESSPLDTLNDAPTKTNVDIKGVGKVPLRTAIGSDLLKNLEAMIAEREAPQKGILSPFIEGLKDASAFTSGNPGMALQARDQEKRAQQESLFGMRNQLATLKSAQAQQGQRNAFMFGQPQAGMQGQPQAGMQGQQGGSSPVAQMLNALPPALRGYGTQLAGDGSFDELAKVVQDVRKNRTELEKNMELIDAMPEGPVKVRLQRQILDKTYGVYEYVDANGYTHKYSLGGPNDPSVAGAKPAPTSQSVPTNKPAVSTGPFKNNNPGNIIANSSWTSKQPGYVGAASNGTAIFDTVENGEKAQHNLLSNDTYGKMPISKVPNVWAPADDGKNPQLKGNNPEAYSRSLQQRTGFDDATMAKPYSQLTPAQQKTYRDAMASIEHGTPTTSKTAVGNVNVSLPNPFPKGSQQYIEQEAKNAAKQGEVNAEIAKKEAEAQIEINKKEPIEDIQAGIKLKEKLDSQFSKVDSTIEAANSVIEENKKHPKAYGLGIEGNALVRNASGVADIILPKEKAGAGENLIASNILSKDELRSRNETNTRSKQLGIDYAAQEFQGARMGIGLERLAAEAKGVDIRNPASQNIAHAAVIGALAQYAKLAKPAYLEYQKTHPDATWNKFTASEDNQKLYKQAREEFVKKHSDVLSVNKDGEIQVNLKGSSTSTTASKFDKFKK